MSRVLVTGASGFIGSHLVEALVAAGHEVTAFCEYNSFGDTGWHDPKLCRTILGDVRDADCMMDVIRHEIPSYNCVFHLAALIGIPYSYGAPRSYVDTNINGTLNVLQACKRAGPRLICTSTSEVYGSCQRAPMAEDHPLSAQSPYAATKIAADQLALSFHRSFGTPVTIVRPFNTYGPRQSLRAVIPNIITQCLDGDDLRLGNVDAIRDYTYVEDTCAGFIAAMEHGKPGDVYNLGAGVAWKISAIAGLVAHICGKEMRYMRDDTRVRPDASEVDRLIASNEKAQTELGWKPQATMMTGLQAAIEWFRENRHRYPQGGYVT